MVPGENTVITHSMLDQRTRSQDPGNLWLATVMPRIIAALQDQPDPPPPLGVAEPFQVGRTEMYDAWVRETEAHLEYVKSLREKWGIQ